MLNTLNQMSKFNRSLSYFCLLSPIRFRASSRGVPPAVNFPTLFTNRSAFFFRSVFSWATRECAEHSWIWVVISVEEVYLKESLHWWQYKGGGREEAVTPVQIVAICPRSSHLTHLITCSAASVVFGWQVWPTERWVARVDPTRKSDCSSEPPIGSFRFPFVDVWRN